MWWHRGIYLYCDVTAVSLTLIPLSARGRESYPLFGMCWLLGNALNCYSSYDVDDININWGDIKLLNNGGWQTQSEELNWETFINKHVRSHRTQLVDWLLFSHYITFHTLHTTFYYWGTLRLVQILILLLILNYAYLNILTMLILIS